MSALPTLSSDFEMPDPDGLPSGWKTFGPKECISIGRGDRDGEPCVILRGAAPFSAGIRREVAGLQDGWYTLRARVRSEGTRNRSWIAIQDPPGEEKRTFLPVLPAGRWLRITVSCPVHSGRCVLSLASEAEDGGWAGFADLELLPGRCALSIRGADVSSLRKSEDRGGVYRREDGSPAPALSILKARGVNFIRLKVWVNPADGYNNAERVLGMARRVKDLDLGLLVDFHYSDFWADPAKQFKPAAWNHFDAGRLIQAVYEHTAEVCRALHSQGTPPEMVQVGNEIQNGMLWPDGKTDSWAALAAFLKAGGRAVKDSCASSQVMLHLAEGGDNALFRAWFDQAVRREVPFDVIGASFYPQWHGNLASLQENLFDIAARYRRDVVVVETAYGFTPDEKDGQKNILQMPVEGYPLTPEGQAAFLRDVMSAVRAVPDGRGLGVFYWEPTWTAVPGNGWDPGDPHSGCEWENQALFDYQDTELPALREFLNP